MTRRIECATAVIRPSERARESVEKRPSEESHQGFMTLATTWDPIARPKHHAGNRTSREASVSVQRDGVINIIEASPEGSTCSGQDRCGRSRAST